MSIPLTRCKKGALFESNVEIPCYPMEFIFAEKLHTTVFRGPLNSRMKDFHDLYLIITQNKIDKNITKVIKMVFEHRQTALELPIVFSKMEFKNLQSFWNRHLRGLKKGHKIPQELSFIVQTINKWIFFNTKIME